MQKKDASVRQDQGTSRALSSFIDPTLSWKDLPWLASLSSMPIVLKGVQTGEDAIIAVRDYGCKVEKKTINSAFVFTFSLFLKGSCPFESRRQTARLLPIWHRSARRGGRGAEEAQSPRSSPGFVLEIVSLFCFDFIFRQKQVVCGWRSAPRIGCVQTALSGS